MLPNFVSSWHGTLRLLEHTITLKNYSKLNQGNEEKVGNLLKSGTLILLTAQVFLIFPVRICRHLQGFGKLLPRSPTDVLGYIFPQRVLMLLHLKRVMALHLFCYSDNTLIISVCVKMKEISIQIQQRYASNSQQPNTWLSSEVFQGNQQLLLLWRKKGLMPFQ